MKTKTLNLVVGVIATLVHSSTPSAADAPLFELRSESRTGDRLNYTFSFREVKRTETSSVVEIVYTTADAQPGAPSRDDILRGMCGVLKARGKQFMLSTLLPDLTEPLHQQILFLKAAPGPSLDQRKVNVVSISECEKYLPR